MAYILIIKANQMYYFSVLFRTDLLSIVRSFDTVYTAIGICHIGYVDY